MKNQPARKRAQPNRRALWHRARVHRLRALLAGRYPDSDTFRTMIAIKGYYPAHRNLFTLREVADAIGASRKVIRAAARKGMIKAKRLPGEKARKLFFTLAAVRRFQKSYPWFSEESGVFRSEKIALDPRVIRGDAVTIDRAKIELGISRRGIEYYLKKRGALKKIDLGHRTILITRESLVRLSRRRLSETERRYAIAKKRFRTESARLGKMHSAWRLKPSDIFHRSKKS